MVIDERLEASVSSPGMRRIASRDLFWASAALAIATVWWWGVYGALKDSGKMSFGAYFGGLALLLLVVFWVGLGAWRRTRWGHTSPRGAAIQFLLLELAGLVVASAIWLGFSGFHRPTSCPAGQVCAVFGFISRAPHHRGPWGYAVASFLIVGLIAVIGVLLRITHQNGSRDGSGPLP